MVCVCDFVCVTLCVCVRLVQDLSICHRLSMQVLEPDPTHTQLTKKLLLTWAFRMCSSSNMCSLSVFLITLLPPSPLSHTHSRVTNKKATLGRVNLLSVLHHCVCTLSLILIFESFINYHSLSLAHTHPYTHALCSVLSTRARRRNTNTSTRARITTTDTLLATENQ